MDSSKKIVTVATLKRRIARHRKEGQTIAFTNGCFDILHYGHVSYLEAAKKKDRILIVGLNSDRSVRMLKGSLRPIVPEDQRAAVLAALACVDYVVLFHEETPYELIKAVQPDVQIKGADYKGKEVVGSDIVRARGGRVELLKFVPKVSTTDIIKAVIEKCRT